MMSETIVEMRAAHRAGRSPVETIRAVYERIAAHADPAIFITLRPEAEVSAEAEALEKSGVSDKPLFGVPFVVKDNIDVAGLPTTAACPAFAYVPLKSAHAVQRLIDAGAILIGKTNLDQFATGLVGMRSPYGVPRNALKAELIPGGSSSGSAVAVAAGIVHFSFGTDTAGSGRVPAALNGIVGLKPSLGLISTAGVLPACRTLDCVSIFAQTVEDAETVLGVAAAYDPDDPFSRRFGSMLTGAMPPVPRIAVPDAASRRFFGDTHAETAFAADRAMLKDLGATLTEIDLSPFYAVAQLLYDGPWVAERYAAIRTFIETQPEAMHPVTRKITQNALEHGAISTFEALYELRRLKRETETALAGFDALVVPSIPGVYTVAELEAEPIALNSNLGTYTNFVNLLDLSAIAVPSGARGDGLPSSITLIGRAGADAHLAAIARAVQQTAAQPMGASRRRPPVPAPAPMLAPAGAIEIAVVGAHLSGMPLNRELIELGGVFLREVETPPDYALYALAGTTPPKPGLLRVAAGEGHAIKAEIWALSPAAFGLFVSRIPAPLGIGTISFSYGDAVQGFLCEAEAVKGAKNVSAFGGWRAYVASLAG